MKEEPDLDSGSAIASGPLASDTDAEQAVQGELGELERRGVARQADPLFAGGWHLTQGGSDLPWTRPARTAVA